MRETVLSTCEKEFLVKSLVEDLRPDCRTCEDFRNLRLLVGADRGSCLAILGNTKVLAHVSCSIAEPQSGRPNEGVLFCNVEMSPMAAEHFEPGRLGDSGVELCRLIERLIKESQCVNTESLCIQSGEKVWEVRLDVTVVDYDGCLADCAAAAALATLLRCRRPDVTILGQQVTVHSMEEKDPIPLNLYHRPVAVTFGFLENGQCTFVDPTAKEEGVIDGTAVFLINSRHEICGIHCSGGFVIRKPQLLKCASRALQRAIAVVDLVNSTLADDVKARSEKRPIGFVEAMGSKSLAGEPEHLPVDVPESIKPALSIHHTKPSTSAEKQRLTKDPSAKMNGAVAHLGRPELPLLTERARPEEKAEDEDDIRIVDEIVAADKPPREITIDSDDERAPDDRRKKHKKTALKDVDQLLGEIEDDVVVLEPEDLGYTAKERANSPEVLEDIDLMTAVKNRPKKKRKQKI